ncbi:MAG: RNA methyltransferase [Bacteroidales bacterium]|nr:RNA methyltransferase [Bacteroidales bacterium]MBN2757980.1 RNA methyltransferase [Bacteroidales bacterium]
MRKLKNSELERKTISEFKNSEKAPFVVVLDNIRSLNNIGSVFRTSDAFLLEAVYLCGITACPPNKEIHKTALGSTDSVDWKYFENTEDAISDLKNKNYIIASVEQVENSISLENFKIDKNKKYAFVFGNEVKGIKQNVVNLSDIFIEIPQLGTKHSINISVSLGVVLWEVFKQYSFE